MKEHLINDRAALKERMEAKRSAVLDWLKGESFTSPQLLCEVLGLQRNATYKTIRSLKKEGLVDTVTLTWITGQIHLVVLTTHGAAMCIDPENPVEVPYYQQGRVAASSIAHQLDVQRVKLKGLRAGWRDWMPDQRAHQLAGAERGKWLKAPDSVATSPEGCRVAIEIERTIKSRKRYEKIIGDYLQMIRAGLMERVDYVTPDSAVAPRLAAVIRSLQSVLVGPEQGPSQRVSITDAHRERFNFYSLEDWPNG